MSSTTPAPAASGGILSGAARKAQVAALLGVLAVVLSYLVANEGHWTWQGTLIAFLSGVVTGGGTYLTTNAGTTYQGSARG
jgi:asparagine N-glycosylation enzyme membrane subunit Stt3